MPWVLCVLLRCRRRNGNMLCQCRYLNRLTLSCMIKTFRAHPWSLSLLGPKGREARPSPYFIHQYNNAKRNISEQFALWQGKYEMLSKVRLQNPGMDGGWHESGPAWVSPTPVRKSLVVSLCCTQYMTMGQVMGFTVFSDWIITVLIT